MGKATKPAIYRESFWGDMGNALLMRPVYRKPKAKAVPPFAPTVAPFGYDITPEMVQEVWDAFVAPDQQDGGPQSAEMRILMGILRSAYVSVGGK